MELSKEDKQTLVENIKNMSTYFLDIIDLIERAASYKTRKEIRLTDAEIKEMVGKGKNAVICMFRNVLCYEKVLEVHGLKEEALATVQNIIEEFKKKKEVKEIIKELKNQEEEKSEGQ